jgi:aryl-alcohol dehydrogenase-like predicted oxidoreductase
MKIQGKATLQGTSRYRDKHQSNCHIKHFHQANEIIASSIGIGTHLGESNIQTNTLVTEAIIESVCHGINLIDSAISYRNQQGECSVAKAIHHLINSGKIQRDELIICTKGGILSEKTSQYLDWFDRHYIQNSNSKISKTDLIQYENEKYHCIHPEYLRDQISWSLDNLGIETIDTYYIHNPEIQLSETAPDILYDRLQSAFEVMEEEVARGRIAAYGLSTWDGFRVPSTSREHLNLERIKSIAQKISGDNKDNFKFIQFPLNIAMPEALLAPTQNIGGEQIPLLEAAYRLGLMSIASASLCQAEVIGQIPETIASSFGKDFRTDCQRALQYARSTPGILSALVGMKSSAHLEENLNVTAYLPMEKSKFKELTYAIVEVLKSMGLDSNDWTFNLSNLSSNLK